MADAETILRDLIVKIAREQDFEEHEVQIKAITSGGANYTSALYLIDLIFPNRKDMNLFAKVAIVGKTMREVMNVGRLYHLEDYFYTKLAKTYEDLQSRHGITGDDLLSYPKYYGCSTKEFQEAVIMENLVARGYGSYSRFEPVDWEHAASTVETLAKFHALSFAYQKEKPEDFEKACEHLVYQIPETTEVGKEYWARMIKNCIGFIREDLRGRFLKSVQDLGEDMNTKFKRPLIAKVLLHGDYRTSNLMYKRKGNKVLTMPVDFQTIHVGCVATDLLYFELLATDAAFRKQHHARLLDHYYEELTAALTRLHVDVTEVYPREVFDEEMKRMMPYAIFLSIALLPIVLVEAEHAPRTDGDLSNFIIPSNDLFAKRFAELIEDCDGWGVL
ncbi:uncharacterized protein LOC126374726 [Pectinophora gossypiella]|uniref:uncharacterized protein LOC126374726 n=1 Tax=Pectinophora gossypiella TaxID=13191 RepID=UPI00214E071B|nr:uncharacterized protein LOC126374726 [Pectinophora gossypiella]